MDGPNVSQRLDALPRRQVDRAWPEEGRVVSEEPVVEAPQDFACAVLPEVVPPGLVARPSMALLARVRDGLLALDAPGGPSLQAPVPSPRREVYGQ